MDSPLNKYIIKLNAIENEFQDQNEINFKSTYIKHQKSTIQENRQKGGGSNQNTKSQDSQNSRKSESIQQKKKNDLNNQKNSHNYNKLNLSNSKIDEISLEESGIKKNEKSFSGKADNSNSSQELLQQQQNMYENKDQIKESQNEDENQSENKSQKEELKSEGKQQQEKSQNKDQNNTVQKQQLTTEQLKFEEAIQISLQNLKKEIQLIPENNWEKQDSKGTWIFHSKEINNVVYLRSEIIFECSKDKVMEYLKNDDLRPKYDELYDQGNNYEEVAPGICLARNQVKGQFTIKARDFMILQKIIYQDDVNYLVVSGTTEFDQKYPPKKNVVRGIIYFGGWVVEKINDNQSKAIFMANSDPKGGLPTMVKKIACSKQAKGVKKLKELVDKMESKK
ncbi:hypothetical protein PPERSA_04882 [Pseudocohnilembus persalinus]|uniref:START domain-containing protein n=1 Tax=Pseudocohnilembus persalinus TaxID=266149 RepID=A0A0V0QJ44_PSEPJ|nr:hypothetical protein PPERSA_04882 [Pseudocohnilembus persalinus]|eukprot:KRX02260.1 hypothetical protein PPERSA_04882 [Pseudocohnilembus persalinus]